MSGEEPKITALKETVKAIEQEIGLAIMFHETWKPTAYDQDLHDRMGRSYATHSFSIVRTALRREMLLALMRVWDTDSQTAGIPTVFKSVSDDDFFDTFTTYRVEKLGEANFISLSEESIGLSTAWKGQVKDELLKRRDETGELIKKYQKGGSRYETVKSLLVLRNVRLAHRQNAPTKPGRADATDEEIEAFYQDTLEIIRLLISLVLARAFDLNEAAEVYRRYAGYFWAGARGETRLENPRYRPPL